MENREELPFMKSVNELTGLADAINAFKDGLEDLLNHIDFVQNTIETKFNSKNWQQRDEDTKSTEKQQEIVSERIKDQSPIAATDTEKDMRTEIEPETKGEGKGRSELQHLARMMCSRGLRKYVVSHLSEIQNHRGEVILALKSAAKPAKLVLDCVGRFFLQGIRAYTKDSPMISSRQASVLMLELFLTVIGESEGEIEMENLVTQEAEKNAIAWRNRLMSEGGLPKACEIDIRGLLLFIACFGIPKTFKNEDVRDLIRFTNLKQIGHLLKGSRVLVSKIPDIIENMKKDGMHVEAVEVVYTFGIEDKFSPHSILISFLQESRESWRKTKRDAPIPLKEANEKHLAALKSVITCLEGRKLDPAKLLPGWQINDKILKLEKDIADLNKQIMEQKITPKRKTCEIESSNKLNSHEMKRSRFTATGSSSLATNGSSLVSSPGVFRLHEPRAANYVDVKSSYAGLATNLLDRGFSSYLSSHSAVSATSHVYNTGALPDFGKMVGGGSSVHAVGVEVGRSPGIGTLPTCSFAGSRGEISGDKVGQTMYANGSSYGWHRAGDVVYNDRVIRQSLTGQPGTIAADSLYCPPPSTECFAGLLNPQSIGVGNQNSSSDLYSFADSVI